MAALAKLSEFKTLLNTSSTDKDAELTLYLERATAVAEALAKRPLLREVDITEYPTVALDRNSEYMRLLQYPVESVSSIKQLYSVSTDAEFTADDALTENEDFVIDDAAIGRVQRVNSTWIQKFRYLQVIYTAGYIDPSTESIPDGAIEPPLDLQQGVLVEALQMFNHKDTGGVEQIQLPNGGSYRTPGLKPNLQLVAAVKALPERITI